MGFGIKLIDGISQANNQAFKMLAGKDVDLTEAEDFGGALADADLILVDDAAAGTQASTKKSALSRVWTYITTKIAAVTDVSSYSWVLDQDDFASNSAAKVPTQQSVKAYINTAGRVGSSQLANDSVTEDKLADTLLAEIDANTAKATNVSTNLTGSTHATQYTINSSDGNNVIVAQASASIAGVMTVAHHDKLDGIESSATADQTKSDINGLAITTVGALSSGTIVSGFGNIDNGSSTLDTGAATVASLVLGGHSVDDIDITNQFVDADAHIMSSKAIGARFALKNADTSGTAATVTGAAQSNITSLGTLSTLSVDNITVDANTVSTTNTNGNLLLAANGTGGIEVIGNSDSAAITLNCSANTHGVKIQAPAHSDFADSYTLTLPVDDGGDGQVLKTDGDGFLAWTDAGSGGITTSQAHAYVEANALALTAALTTNSTIDGRDVAADGVTADAALPKAGGAMTGAITTNSTFDGVDIATRDAVLTSTTTTAGAALPKAGGAMTGAITTNSTFDGRDVAADGVTADAALSRSGGTMSGAIAMGGQNITGGGTITGTTLTGSSLDINGAADISGNLAGVDTLTATTLSVTNYGLASGDIPNNAANTTGVAEKSNLASLEDESSDVSCFVTFAQEATGYERLKTGSNLTFNSDTGTLTAPIFNGKSGTTTRLHDARTINGVSFNGTANVNIPPIAGVTGTNDYVLTADSSAASGMVWRAASETVAVAGFGELFSSFTNRF